MLEDVGEGGVVYFWGKNTLIPVDLVALDTEGLIRSVRRDMAPSVPGTPWRKVVLMPLEGRYLLTLPAGEAGRAGLSAGMKIAGLPAPRPMMRAPELARLILEGGEPGLQAVLAHFKDNPGDYAEFDTVVGLLNLDRSAATRLYDAVLRGKIMSGNYIGILAWHDPVLWFKRAPMELRISLILAPMIYPLTFVHESGHYLAARLLGREVVKFRAFPTGGGFISQNEHATTKNWRNAVVSLGGPVLQFAAGLMFLAIGGLMGGLPLYDMIAAGMTVIGSFYIGMVVPGGGSDIAHAAHAMGWTRLNAEILWRMRQPRYAIGGMYHILFDLLIGERLGFGLYRSDRRR